jgi:hypothetical protein
MTFEMKFHALLLLGSVLLLSAGIACDDPESRDSNSTSDSASDSARVANQASRKEPATTDLSGVRARADAAFAELKGGRTRFESRIGPQPWPDDLPKNWPIPDPSKVLANTSQKEGGRLLLVDLPGSLDHVVEYYAEALERGGYRVARFENERSLPILSASQGRDEATLTFIARGDTIRVEILLRRGA